MMKAKPSDPYEVTYRVSDTLSYNERYIEALTPVFEAAEAVVLKQRSDKEKINKLK